MTSLPPQRSCSRSRYRVGMTIRPLASRVSLLAPLNILIWVRKPILSHFFPPTATIGSAVSHCQRLKLKKTRDNSDLDHIWYLEVPFVHDSFGINLLAGFPHDALRRLSDGVVSTPLKGGAKPLANSAAPGKGREAARK